MPESLSHFTSTGSQINSPCLESLKSHWISKKSRNTYILMTKKHIKHMILPSSSYHFSTELRCCHGAFGEVLTRWRSYRGNGRQLSDLPTLLAWRDKWCQWCLTQLCWKIRTTLLLTTWNKNKLWKNSTVHVEWKLMWTLIPTLKNRTFC